MSVEWGDRIQKRAGKHVAKTVAVLTLVSGFRVGRSQTKVRRFHLAVDVRDPSFICLRQGFFLCLISQGSAVPSMSLGALWTSLMPAVRTASLAAEVRAANVTNQVASYSDAVVLLQGWIPRLETGFAISWWQQMVEFEVAELLGSPDASASSLLGWKRRADLFCALVRFETE